MLLVHFFVIHIFNLTLLNIINIYYYSKQMSKRLTLEKDKNPLKFANKNNSQNVI